jgi:putative transposase
MPQSFAAMYAHVIFSTKNREPSIETSWQSRLYEYIGGIAKGNNFVLLSAGGMPDHIHLLLSIGRELSVADIVRLVKSNSSKWIHETIPGKGSFAWQAGYGAFSVSQSGLASVKTYIAGQDQHHRRMTFQEEFLAFLKKHVCRTTSGMCGIEPPHGAILSPRWGFLPGTPSKPGAYAPGY